MDPPSVPLICLDWLPYTTYSPLCLAYEQEVSEVPPYCRVYGYLILFVAEYYSTVWMYRVCLFTQRLGVMWVGSTFWL